MEAEARDILISALQRARADLSWIGQLIETGEELGGVELDIPSRELTRGTEWSSSTPTSSPRRSRVRTPTPQ